MRRWWWIPNFLTSLRVIAGAMVFVYLLLESLLLCGIGVRSGVFPAFDYKLAALGCAVFGAITDFLDGYLARKCGWQTEIGKIFDPAADKSFDFWVFAGVLVYYVRHSDIVWYIFTFVIPGAYIIWYSTTTTRMRKRGEIKEALALAKRKTAVLMVAKIIFIVEIALGAYVPDALRTLLLVIGTWTFAIGAIMCHFALKQYRTIATAT